MPKLNPRARKPKCKDRCPPPKSPVKYSHLCDIDCRTATGSKAWERQNSLGAQRVDANRALHQLTGSHEQAVSEVAKRTSRNVNQTIDTVQLRTLTRIVKELENET